MEVTKETALCGAKIETEVLQYIQRWDGENIAKVLGVFIDCKHGTIDAVFLYKVPERNE